MPKSPLRLAGERDHLFAGDHYPRPFAFNADVARVFDDMALRSIPLYREVIDATAAWAAAYYQPGSEVVDVGCSTGTTLAALARSLPDDARFCGIDTSAPMLAQAQKKLTALMDPEHFRLVHTNALDYDFKRASVVVINYTLQFIPITKRAFLLKRIYESLEPGGLLIVSDKVRSICPPFEETVTAIYESFKAERGYTRDEIARKKEALDNVLVPLNFADEVRLIGEAGFNAVEPIMKWHNFVTLVALKHAR